MHAGGGRAHCGIGYATQKESTKEERNRLKVYKEKKENEDGKFIIKRKKTVKCLSDVLISSELPFYL